VKAAPPFAVVDHHRAHRRGFPEVIYCEGKTPSQVVAIGKEILSRAGVLLATRAREEHARAFLRAVKGARYHRAARILSVERQPLPKRGGAVALVAAGTSDLPVAEEAAVTAEVMGGRVERFYDVGVAGIHRILSIRDRLSRCSVLIVVAGMEGALPSVVAGLLDKPVIAVPTSVGYGTGFGGIAALLGMLNSCSSGVTVVNIDNGFGAACAATLINRQLR
jgi:NCAIR mutase (PurE)-related protein